MSSTTVVKAIEPIVASYQQGEYDGVVQKCEKALRSGKDHPLLRAVLSSALVETDRHEEAVENATVAIDNPSLAPVLLDPVKFVRAYALYGAQRLDEALEVVKEIQAKKTSSVYVTHLEAQILSRMRRHEEASVIYRTTLESTGRRRLTFFSSSKASESPVKREEILTNLGYNLACSESNAPTVLSIEKESPESVTADVLFNIAYGHLLLGDVKRAEEVLLQARNKAREVLDLEGEADQDDELARYNVQLTCVKHHKGEIEAANAEYAEVLKKKVTDASVVAVASNNLCAIKWADHDRKVQSIVRSMKATMGPGVDSRLVNTQRKAMGCNRAIVGIEMSKFESAQKELDGLRTLFPDDDEVLLIQTSLLTKLKRYDEAEKAIAAIGDAELRFSAAAQMKLSMGDLSGAADALINLGAVPSAIATAATLYEKADQVDKAKSCLLEASTQWSQSGSRDLAAKALRRLANLLERHGRHKEAMEALDHVLVIAPDDEVAIANLVISSSTVDQATAVRYAERLPPLQAAADLDPDALEFMPVPKRRERQLEMEKRRARMQDGEPEENGISKTKKKKKKSKRPKNLDPNAPPPDPERWLPMSMRAANKKRRKRQEATSRASQGAGLAATEAAAERMAAAAAAAGSSTQTGPSKTEPPRRAQAKRNQRRKPRR